MSSTHAAPLRAINSAEVTGESSIVARKTVPADDPYLAGHYPGEPVYPGVFHLESAVQAIRLLHAPRDPRLRCVASLRVTAPVRPGDELVITVHTTDVGGMLRAKVTCALADGSPVARLRLDFAPGEESHAGPC